MKTGIVNTLKSTYTKCRSDWLKPIHGLGSIRCSRSTRPPSPYVATSQPAPSVGPSRPGYTKPPIWSYSRTQILDNRMKSGDLTVLNRYQLDEYIAFRSWRAPVSSWVGYCGFRSLPKSSTRDGQWSTAYSRRLVTCTRDVSIRWWHSRNAHALTSTSQRSIASTRLASEASSQRRKILLAPANRAVLGMPSKSHVT